MTEVPSKHATIDNTRQKMIDLSILDLNTFMVDGIDLRLKYQHNPIKSGSRLLQVDKISLSANYGTFDTEISNRHGITVRVL